MTCEVIATGSTGNAVLLNGEILIDCGVPFKKLEPYVKDLKLVLLTHEHSDHFKPRTISALHKARPTLRFVCCKWMVPHLLKAKVGKRVIDVMNPDRPAIACYPVVADIHPFHLEHDVPNCGWRIYLPYDNREKVIYATDCHDLDNVSATGYDLYLIEANHREREIQETIKRKKEAGEFCYEERAAQVHMSEERALAWLDKNMGPRSQYILLHGHVEKGGANA